MYVIIIAFYNNLGKLWIITTATSTGQQNTTCKVYDVTAVAHSKVYFGRIFYRNGERVEMRLNGTLEFYSHPHIKQQMNYRHYLKVTPPGETPFYEHLLYASDDSNCGVFYVISGHVRFYELRLWNSSAVSAYRECLREYVYFIPERYLLTTYCNGLCPKIFSQSHSVQYD